MRVGQPVRRLEGFWGAVDARHNALIRAQVERGPVLDLGCGYGTLTTALSRGAGIDCVGVDSDPSALAEARLRCPTCRFEECDASEIPFADATFGTVVMRDSLHHLANSSEWPAIGREILRVLVPDGRVVVLDPNVTAIVLAARVVARHEDETCSVGQAQVLLRELGLRVRAPSFNTLFSLPLSGGYVGVALVPRLPWLHRLLMTAEASFERLLPRRVLRLFAWRYLIVADRV